MSQVVLDNIYLEMLTQDALKNRRIHLNDGVDDISIFKITYMMDKLRKMDEVEGIPMNKRLPITIVVNSYGGHIFEAMNLIGKMERFIEDGYEIITETGKACSCGHMIFQCGSHRRMNRYGYLMIHQLSSGSYGNYEQLKVEQNFNTRLQKKLDEITLAKTKIPKKLLLKKTKGLDWWLDAEECLKYGVCDEII